MAASAGLDLDEWQQSIVLAALGVTPGDMWAAFEVGMIVPRQDGKGGILEAVELGALFLFDWVRLATHTAHLFPTAIEHFFRVASLIESTPHLSRRVRRILTANGKESIELLDGSRLKFLARSGGAGRGFTGDLVVLDEAMILPPASMGALLPTMSARPNPQLWYVGSAGDESSEVLASVRDRGIAGGDPQLCYVEYAAGDPGDHVGDKIDLDDRAEWRRANPAMWTETPRITEEFTVKERVALPDDQFARERLCLWTVGRRLSVIDPDQWQTLISVSEPGPATCFAVDVPPERTSASIVVASELPDGKRHVELVDHRAGTGWVVDRLVELDKKHLPGQIAMLPSSPAGSLIAEIVEALAKERVPVLTVGGVEYAAACGQFLDAVTEATLVVHDGPNVHALSSAADAARKRVFTEGGFVWNRRDSEANIAPLVAATLASFALSKPPKKRRKRRTQDPFT